MSAAGRGLVSQAGTVLPWETMRGTGLGRGLSEGLARWRAPRAVHDPGKIVADLAAAVALGGDCLADIAVLREQPELAGAGRVGPGRVPAGQRAGRRRGPGTHGRRETVARRRMPPARQGANRSGPAPGPDLALFVPAHRAVHGAQALLAIAAARPAPSAVESPAPGGNRQPAAWRDMGKLPAAAGDRPPGDDPGLVKVSVPEARRLLRLATTPMSQAARDLGYAWSRWRRRHQARARWHHYHAQLKAARVA